jgi:hypothetical protein
VTYRFAGFFANPSVPAPDVLPDGAVWKEIKSPFEGVGLRLDSLVGESPDVRVVAALAERFGFSRADRWIYLTYDCWGGQLDFVFGLGMKAGLSFGPRESSDEDRVEAEYLGLMQAFGLTDSEALNFAPFSRGFWGEN